MKPIALSFWALTLVACGSSTGAVDAGANDPQVPPLGAANMQAWLAGGAYKAWACRTTPADGGGPHGSNRICSNAKLSKTPATATAYEEDSATVKELLEGPDSGVVVGHAVMRKLGPDAGVGAARWYFFEVVGTTIAADRAADPSCQSCHAAAPKDFVYNQIP